MAGAPGDMVLPCPYPSSGRLLSFSCACSLSVPLGTGNQRLVSSDFTPQRAINHSVQLYGLQAFLILSDDLGQ